MYEIVVKKGLTTVAAFVGVREAIPALTDEDYQKILDTEEFLERLTGLRVHINTR